jgi:hypothetical protein
VAVAVVVASALLLGAAPSASGAGRLLPSCTPQLVYTFAPGNVDVAGFGESQAQFVDWTDARGNPRQPTAATITWDARAIATMPSKPVGATPRISGWLDFSISTAEGERITFEGSCIAGAGGFGPYPNEYIVLYANGIARGWPGAPAKRAFVHFEAWREGDVVHSYVALIEGKDCALNFDALVVTRFPWPEGTGDFTFSGDRDFRFIYSETNCARQYGNPVPATLAPGQQ